MLQSDRAGLNSLAIGRHVRLNLGYLDDGHHDGSLALLEFLRLLVVALLHQGELDTCGRQVPSYSGGSILRDNFTCSSMRSRGQDKRATPTYCTFVVVAFYKVGQRHGARACCHGVVKRARKEERVIENRTGGRHHKFASRMENLRILHPQRRTEGNYFSTSPENARSFSIEALD